MRALSLAWAVTLASPAIAQSMAGMSGMTAPAPPLHQRHGPAPPDRREPTAKAGDAAPRSSPTAAPPIDRSLSAQRPAAMGEAPMPAMAMDHAVHDAGGMETAPSGTALVPGDALPPSAPTDHYADRTFPAGEMDAARAQMMREQGGQDFDQVLVNLAEARFRNGRDGYRWDGEGWFGGDVNRLWVKSEGSGSFRDGVDAAEIQALYSRAIGPYVNVQGGVRHDLAPTPTRTYASIGVEGLAPYRVQVEMRGFVATTGQVLGRIEGWYDQRLTQRLVLQPRVELNLAAQDDAPMRTGAGLSDAEIGLRLRYEIVRQVAPYVGVSHEARTGRTAEYARVDGHRPTQTSLVAGVRFWF